MTEQEKKGIVLQFFRATSPDTSAFKSFLKDAGCSTQQLAAWIEGKEDIPEEILTEALKKLEEDRDTYDFLVKNLEEFTAPGHHVLRP